MQKRTLTVTDEAQADLDAILEYLLTNTSAANAAQVMGWIEQTIESLCEGAERYAIIERDGVVKIMRGVRVHACRPLTGKRVRPTRWVVYFQLHETTVGVIGVRHTSQKPIWEE